MGFRSLREAIDNPTAGGWLVFHDRNLAGLAAARARSRQGGRSPKLSSAQQAMARRLYAERAHTVAEIGQLLGISRTSVYRVLGKQPAANSAAADSPAASPPRTSRRADTVTAVTVVAKGRGATTARLRDLAGDVIEVARTSVLPDPLDP